MGLIKHSCQNCNSDLVIPESVERICCPACGNHFLVEIFEDVVTLRKIKDEELPVGIETSISPPQSIEEMQEDVDFINRKVDLLNRKITQCRLSAFSSLSVSALFFCFALVWLLADRMLMALLCGVIAAVTLVAAGTQLREAARSRSSLIVLISQRERLLRQIKPNLPRIF
jgi:hypothetical protein